MHKIDDINSILNAVNFINLKPKKKKINIPPIQNFIPKFKKDSIIPFDVDKIIKEAEVYKKKSSFFSKVDLILNKNDVTKTKNYNKTFEEAQAQIIDDLYSKFTKKIKKIHLKLFLIFI